MRKWNEKSTLNIEIQVQELQGRRIKKRDSFRKMPTPVSSEQSPRSRTWTDPICDVEKKFSLVWIHGKCMISTITRTRWVLSPVRWRRENSLVYWMVWIQWPGTLEPQECKALVEPCAQCTLMTSKYKGAEPICISEATGECKVLCWRPKWAEQKMSDKSTPLRLAWRLHVSLVQTTSRGVFQRPKRVLVEFCYICLGDGGH